MRRLNTRLARRLWIGAALAGVLALVGGTGALAATVSIVNGSFESGMSGWTVVSPVENVCGWQAADGNCAVDMDASPSAGRIEQAIATSAGQSYTVTFALAGNPTCTPTSPSWVGWLTESPIKYLQVSASGATPAVYSFDTTSTSVTNMGWTTQTYGFVATGSSTTLAFASTVFGNCGPMLDNVRVSTPLAVPATASDCKKGGWQNVVDRLGDHFKNQGDCVSYVATAGRNLGAIAP